MGKKTAQKTNFFERIIQGFRYVFTGKLPKKEAKYISDYIYVDMRMPKGVEVNSMSEAVRHINLISKFATEMEPILQYEFELYSKCRTKVSLLHFEDLLDSPYIGKH